MTAAACTALAIEGDGSTASWVVDSSPRLPGTSSQNAGRNTTSRGRDGLIASTRYAPRLAASAPRKLPSGADTCWPSV